MHRETQRLKHDLGKLMVDKKHYFIYRVDKPNSAALRMRTRQAHLDYAATLGATLVFAGPAFSDDEETMIGSVWVLQVASRDEAEAITRSDPYEKVGLFQSKIVQLLLKVIPAS
jgi:uncharacterized protein YciI